MKRRSACCCSGDKAVVVGGAVAGAAGSLKALRICESVALVIVNWSLMICMPEDGENQEIIHV